MLLISRVGGGPRDGRRDRRAAATVNKMLGKIRLHVIVLIVPHMRRSRDDLVRCGILIHVSVSQSAEVLALKQESRILGQDECPRILLSCYRARNSGPKSRCITEFVDEESETSYCSYFSQDTIISHYL